MVWLSLDSLIINPPLLFNLGVAADAAFRPVHHRNVGSPAREPPDAFWQGIYAALGVGDALHGRVVCRRTDAPALLNTHCFAFNPATGLGRAWWRALHSAGSRTKFSRPGRAATSCTGPFSPGGPQHATARTLGWEWIRLLRPEYNYPLNLLNEMPVNRRPPASTAWSTPVYEDAFPWDEIEVGEPLRSWLRQRLPG